MNMLGTTLYALIERDLANRRAFRFGLIADLIAGAFFFAGLFFIAKLVPIEYLGGKNYFSVAAIGIALFSFLGAVSSAPRSFLISELNRGTFETLLTLKPTLITYLAAAAIQNTARAFARMAVVIGVGAWFGGGMTFSGVLWLMPVLLIAGAAAFGFGLLTAGLDLGARKAGRIVGVFSGAAVMLTGVYFPVALLPEPLRLIADFIPVTHAISAARRILFDGNVAAPDLLALALLAVILLLTGYRALRMGEESMRRNGTFIIY